MSLFATKLVDEYGNATYNLTGLGYGALVALMLVLLILACYLTGDKAKLKTKHLVFSAVAMALAMITSFLKLFEAPMGGSVTLFSMLFICCIGYWYGLRTGIMTGVAYGLLNFANSHLTVSESSLFSNVTTVVSVLAGVILLKEPFSLWQILGVAVILVCVFIANVSASSDKK